MTGVQTCALPISIFKINPNFSLNLFAVPLLIIYIILYPFAKFSTFLSKWILRIMGMRTVKDGHNGLLTKVDLDFFIQQSIDESSEMAPKDTEVKIFQNALDFSNLKVRDCMIPRSEITAISINSEITSLMNVFIDSGYSKIPVYRNNIDNIVGYIHSAEMFKRPKNWTSKLNQIPIVPETMAVNKLMKQLLDKKRSIAVVVDEFGGTAEIGRASCRERGYVLV